MSTNLNKIILLAVAMALLLSLTACGGGEGEDEAPTKHVNDPNPVAPPKPTVCGTTYPSPAGC